MVYVAEKQEDKLLVLYTYPYCMITIILQYLQRNMFELVAIFPDPLPYTVKTKLVLICVGKLCRLLHSPLESEKFNVVKSIQTLLIGFKWSGLWSSL